MARNVDLHQWARVGAAARLKEIQEEVAAIYRAFPELRGQRGLAAASPDRGRKRKRFSAAGKAAISDGMRKYWARRKAKAAKAAAK